MNAFPATLLLIITGTVSAFCQTTVSWKETATFPHMPANTGNLSIAVDKATDDIYVGTIRSGIFRSKDQGNTWQQVMQDGVMIRTIVITEDHMFATGIAVIYRSDDGGDTWSPFFVPTDHTITDLVVTANGNVVVSTGDVEELTDSTSNYTGDGIFISSDNGATWINSSTGLNQTKAISHLAIDSKGRLYAGSNHYQELSWHDAGTGVYYSNDTGRTWSRFDKIWFGTGSSRDHIRKIYEILTLEVDEFDSVYVAYEGAGSNYQMSGSFRNSYEGAMSQTSWQPLKLRNEPDNWSFKPMNSFYRSAAGDLYASIFSPVSRSTGGPYVQLNGYTGWQRSIEGIIPPFVGDEFGHRTCMFAETSRGNVFAIQHNDPRVYIAQKTIIPTGIHDLQPIEVTIYPNPANSRISIRQGIPGELLCSLFAIDGKLISQQPVSDDSSIDVTTVPEGLYLLKIVSGNGQQLTRKVSIVH
jgi:hypothetical protein